MKTIIEEEIHPLNQNEEDIRRREKVAWESTAAVREEALETVRKELPDFIWAPHSRPAPLPSSAWEWTWYFSLVSMENGAGLDVKIAFVAVLRVSPLGTILASPWFVYSESDVLPHQMEMDEFMRALRRIGGYPDQVPGAGRLGDPWDWHHTLPSLIREVQDKVRRLVEPMLAAAKLFRCEESEESEE